MARVLAVLAALLPCVQAAAQGSSAPQLTADGAIAASRAFGSAPGTLPGRPGHSIDVRDRGAAATCDSDDAPAINAAVAAVISNGGHGGRVLLPGGCYRVDSPIVWPAPGDGAALTIEGPGPDATIIKAGAAMAAVIHGAGGSSRAGAVRGLTLDGNGLAQNGVQMSGVAGGSRVEGNRIVGVTQNAILFRGASDLFIAENTIEAPGLHGIALTLASSRFAVARNMIRDPGGAGVIFSQGNSGSISGNYVYRGGPGGDGVSGYHHRNSDVAITGNVIDAAENHGIHVGGARLSITGNTINGTGMGDCIGVSANVGGSSANAEAPSSLVAVTGNSCSGAKRFGISMLNAASVTVAGNVVEASGQADILVGKSSLVGVSGNVSKDARAHGIVLRGSTNSHVSGNLVQNPAGSGVRMERAGGGAEAVGNTVAGNRVIGGTTSYLEADASGGNTYAGNVADAYSLQPFSRATGGSVWQHGSPSRATLASAASLPLPGWGDLFTITGITTIASVDGGGWTGRRITLLFKGSVKVGGRKSNLRLNGNAAFAAVPGNTLTLLYDGANWVEVGRGTGAS